jgi:hypothetical protein
MRGREGERERGREGVPFSFVSTEIGGSIVSFGI